MPDFQQIDLNALNENPFALIGKQWMAICAGDEVKCNAMTASWGGLGVMWGKNVAYVVIRPTRFTKEFVDANQRFALCFLPEHYRKELTYLGTVSGHTEDKITQSGLKPMFDAGTPYFTEAFLALFCRKLYAQPFEPGCFIEKSLDPQWYPDHDYHTLYIAEIDKVLIKK